MTRERIYKNINLVFMICGIILIFYGLYHVYSLQPTFKGLDRNTQISIGYSTNFAIASIGFGITSLFIAFTSMIMAYTTDKKIKVIVDSGIQDAIIFLLENREKFFNAIANELHPAQIRNKTEWATWNQIRGLRNIVKFKDYLSDDDKRDVLRGHEILINNIMREEFVHLLLNRHPKQLLMGCRILKEELDNLTIHNDNYEQIYFDLFTTYLLPRNDNEDFLDYVNRNIQAVNKGGRPFVRLNELQEDE